MQSKKSQNNHDSRHHGKYSGANTLVMAISLYILFMFLFANGSGQLFGVNDMFGTIQFHSL